MTLLHNLPPKWCGRKGDYTYQIPITHVGSATFLNDLLDLAGAFIPSPFITGTQQLVGLLRSSGKGNGVERQNR